MAFSHRVQDVGGWTEDYCYMAFDDKLYRPATAQRALRSFVGLLKSCAADPEQARPAPAIEDTRRGGCIPREQLPSAAPIFKVRSSG